MSCLIFNPKYRPLDNSDYWNYFLYYFYCIFVIIVCIFCGQVPQYILDDYAKRGRRCKIAVTQPRRIAAISIAKRVCHERGTCADNL